MMGSETISVTMPYLWWRGLMLMIGAGAPMAHSLILKELGKAMFDGRSRESDEFTVTMPEAVWQRLVSKCAVSENAAYVLVSRSLRKALREQSGRDFVAENLVRVSLEAL